VLSVSGRGRLSRTDLLPGWIIQRQDCEPRKVDLLTYNSIYSASSFILKDGTYALISNLIVSVIDAVVDAFEDVRFARHVSAKQRFLFHRKTNLIKMSCLT
jgi:dihydroneopterin aldolase